MKKFAFNSVKNIHLFIMFYSLNFLFDISINSSSHFVQFFFHKIVNIQIYSELIFFSARLGRRYEDVLLLGVAQHFKILNASFANFLQWQCNFHAVLTNKSTNMEYSLKRKKNYLWFLVDAINKYCIFYTAHKVQCYFT